MKDIKLFIKNIKKYIGYAMYSAKSELKSDVVNSYLNWIWWVLEPICMMLIYIFVVEVVFKTKELNFPVFVFIGITIWDYFSKMITSSVKMLKNKKSIVSKVYIPKYILIIEKSFVLAFKAMISFGLILILMFIFKVKYTLYLLLFPILFGILYIFTFGLCCIIMHCGVYVDDLSNILSIILKFLLYFSGIFYNIQTKVPVPFNKFLLTGNMVAFFIDSFRKIFMYELFPNFLMLGFWLVIGLAISFLGIKLTHKYENTYVKMI